MKKALIIIVIVGFALFVLMQFVPIDRQNPPTTSEPNWSSPEARALVLKNCGQCHSNNTEWPWYSYIAPASWLIKFDVVRGRNQFNFSDWNNNPGYVGDLAEAIQSGRMPPIQYTLFHPDAKLDAQGKQALIDALTSSLGK
jgi:mono/diheme cytochrome c family protein